MVSGQITNTSSLINAVESLRWKGNSQTKHEIDEILDTVVHLLSNHGDHQGGEEASRDQIESLTRLIRRLGGHSAKTRASVGVKEVAQVLYKVHQLDDHRLDWSECPERLRRIWIEMAEAAVAAMREEA